MINPEAYNGVFVPRDTNDAGHLVIDGPDSILKLVAKIAPNPGERGPSEVHGTLQDGKKASLLRCIRTSSTRTGRADGEHNEIHLFPNYVAIGEHYFSTDETKISAIIYHFENAESMIAGHRTFVPILPDPDDARAFLASDHRSREAIAEKHGWGPSTFMPEIGDNPSFLYYSGVGEIIRLESQLGAVAMENHTSHQMWGEATGIGFDNRVFTKLQFAQPKNLDDALATLRTLHSLLELNLGHRQRFREISLQLESDDTQPDETSRVYLELHWSDCNTRVEGTAKPTHPLDRLLDPQQRPDEFREVVSGWMNSSAKMSEARGRFGIAFSKIHYDFDRTVGAANMFDLLPADRLPPDHDVDDKTKDAVSTSRDLFKNLVDSSARQSILSALGRVGKASLKDKILHRAAIVQARTDHFPELSLPCKEAVVCRNHFVHGSPPTFNYQNEITAFAFLSDTLEFVFAISDLIELGWSLEDWMSSGLDDTHNFSRYVVHYRWHIDHLKEILEKSKP